MFEFYFQSIRVWFFIGNKVLALGKKYAISYKQLNDDLGKYQKELSGLIGELTGDELTILGLNELINGGKE